MKEKPIECSHCKKKADVVYSEMIGTETTTWHMCKDCPILHAKLQGKEDESTRLKKDTLCCNNCQTSLDSILMGEPIGCAECYQIFQDVLVEQMTQTNQISPRLKPNSKIQNSTLHIGKSPYIDKIAVNSSKIRDLNKSLNEALKGENYEEAAWLRDQINELMEKSDEGS